MTVHFISRAAQRAVETARGMLAAGTISRDHHTFDVPAWRFRLTDISALSGGEIDRKSAIAMGFRPAVGHPDSMSLVCGEGPGAVVSRLMSAAKAGNAA